jgi:GT2 family glycosyltransferase
MLTVVNLSNNSIEEVCLPNKTTQIYILCRDRLEYAREAISSAVNQNVTGIQVVVSDNSEGDAVGNMISAEFPDVTYIRRRPALDALEHFFLVMRESNAEYVVFFHDDDVLDEGYVLMMRTALQVHPNIVAVGCNAKVLRDKRYTDNFYMTKFTNDIFLTRSEELLDYYFRFNNHRAAPFSGYMYRRSAIEGLCVEINDGGKYNDVIFLIKLIARGNIFWLAKSLMHYRMHGSNDSVVENVGHRLRLLRYVYKNTNIKRKSEAVQEFKFRYWSRWWLSKKMWKNTIEHKWRRRIVLSFLCGQAIRFMLTKPGFWLRLLSGAR